MVGAAVTHARVLQTTGMRGRVPPRRSLKALPTRLAAVLALLSATVAAMAPTQAASPPAIPLTAVDTVGFVPAGWTLHAQAHGDLNRDGRDDLALVLQGTSPDRIIRNDDGLGVPEYDTNPRILVVAFGEAGGFRRVLRQDDFIAIREEPTMDDPFAADGLMIARGTLRADFHVWYSAGSWGTSEMTYTFRYQHRNFKLIGYDRSDIMRNTGKVETISANFSTGKAELCTGMIDGDGCDTRKTVVLPKAALLELSELGDALDDSNLPLPRDETE